MSEFIEFPKISRFSRNCVVTEKIDGTNGCIFIGEDGEFMIGSGTRWITPETDNHGFAKWAYENKEELMKLGPGRHFGEWWGSGIQRGYGLEKGEKRFSLFNVSRWHLAGKDPKPILSSDPRVVEYTKELPACVGLVPVIWEGNFDELDINSLIDDLKYKGSMAAAGYRNPEGLVVYHVAGNVLFKKTIEKDDVLKTLSKS